AAEGAPRGASHFGGVWLGALLGAHCAAARASGDVVAESVCAAVCPTAKTDRTDAEAMLEAARSGGIPPVAVKTVTQQDVLALHRMRAPWMMTRTARLNAMRGLLLEHGIAIARGAHTLLRQVAARLANEADPLPPRLRIVLRLTVDEVRDLEDRID